MYVMGRSGRRRIVGSLAALTVAAMAMAGCGGNDDEEKTATAAGAPAAESKKSVDLAMVMSFKIPYFIAAQNGAQAAAKADGAIKLSIDASDAPTGVKEAAMAENLLAQGPDGFAVNPCVLPAWQKVLRRMETEIADNNVIAWSCKQAAVKGQASTVKTFVGASDVQSGAKTVALAIDQAKLTPETTGTALVSECAKGTPILDQRVIGAEAELAKRLPKVKVVNFTTDPADQTKNTATWSSVVQDNPDAVVAFGPCDSDTGSLVTLKKKTDVKFAVSLLDPTLPGLQAIERGEVDGGVTTAPWMAGYVTIELLAKAARGEGAAPEGWIDTGIYPVTKDDVGDYLKAARSPAGQEALFKPKAQELLADLDGRTQPLDASFGTS